MSDYDVIVIGGGPGGYLAAERLGHTGKKVLLAEQERLGGTCVNVGCIPTKSLLNSAKLYDHARHGEQFGVTATNVTADWSAMQAWKTTVVDTLVKGITGAERRAGVEVVAEHATLLGSGVVRLASGAEHRAQHVIVATGSVPAMPPIPGTKGNDRVVDSTGLLAIPEIPTRLAVIGGGVIGVEFASLFATLGSEVTVIEMLDEIVPFADPEIAAALRTGISGVTFRLGAQVTGVDGGAVHFTTADGPAKVEADVVLMAVGRRPLVDGWGAVESGLDVSPRGVRVDDHMRTNLPNVWAIGDVTGRSLLAHAAYRMADIAAANIIDPVGAPQHGQRMRWDTVPWAVYSAPEAAGVGLTEPEATRRGHRVATATVRHVLSGRFVAENGLKAPGSTKVVADADTGRLLGIHLIGPSSAETIWGAAAALESEFTVQDLRQVVFPHPTISEVIREAVWALAL